jgi:hypothetical protein
MGCLRVKQFKQGNCIKKLLGNTINSFPQQVSEELSGMGIAMVLGAGGIGLRTWFTWNKYQPLLGLSNLIK